MAEVRLDSVTKNFGAFKALDQVSKDMRICHFARICVDLFDG